MSLTEGLLIAIVIILTIAVLSSARKSDAPPRARTWDCVDRNSGEITSVRMQYSGPSPAHGAGCKCPKCASPEGTALSENAEYFAGCQDPSERKQALSCMCDDDDKFSYAVDEFGAPGMTYKDWVASQAVDPQVLKNHSEFVKDRLGDNTQNITGRTYALGEVEGTDQTPWWGIRGRPQAVPTCGSVAQVPDVDPRNFTEKPRFNWNSSV